METDVRLSDELIMQMLQNTALHEQFPFLARPIMRPIQQNMRPCIGCGEGLRPRVLQKPQLTIDMEAMRKHIAFMEQHRKCILKKLLGITVMRVRYKHGNKVIDDIF